MQLSMRDAPLIYAYGLKDRGFIHHLPKRELYLNPPGAAIGCTENSALIQVFLSEQRGEALYTHVFGRYGPHTVDMLDLLCAICSSRTPMVVQHTFLPYPLNDVTQASLRESFDRCRLGGYASSVVDAPGSLKATIDYPI